MKHLFVFLLAGLMSVISLPTLAQKNAAANKVIAHRGAWKNTGAPQNSIAALQAAIQLGCVGSEFDVRMTADGHPVVNHDPTHQGVSIDKTDWATVSKLTLANGEPIPTLEAYLNAGKKQKTTRLVLEIKTHDLGKEKTLELTRKCVALVKKMKMQKVVDYIAFDYDACKLVAELDPKANIAYLSGNFSPSEIAADNINGIDYNLKALKTNENWIQEAHQNKQTVNVWTVNSEDDMKWFLSKNVDFITTDEPELLFRITR